MQTSNPDALYAERMPPQQMFFSFDGRISRREFWLYGVGGLLGLGLLGQALLGIAGMKAEHADLAVNLALVWPALAISAKRWHDRGRSAAWLLINLLPVIGWLWALVDNGFVRGTPGPNRFGQDPLQAG